MSLILPFSDTGQHASGGIWDATTAAAIAANFPCVKHFWRITETSGSTITDTAGGRICTLTSPTWGTANAVVPAPGGASNSAITGGALTNPGTSPIILMGVGKFNSTNALIYGSNGLGAVSLSKAATTSLTDGNNTLAGTAFTDGTTTIYGRANACDWTNQQNFEATATATITALAAVATTAATPASIAGGIADIDEVLRFDANTTALYGLMFIKFAGTLPNAAFIKSMLAWHTYQWSNGNKWIYPGLKGVA